MQAGETNSTTFPPIMPEIALPTSRNDEGHSAENMSMTVRRWTRSMIGRRSPVGDLRLAIMTRARTTAMRMAATMAQTQATVGELHFSHGLVEP